MQLVKIRIPNWLKYNPRPDRAVHTWFRFQNNFFSDQRLFGATDAQLLLFIMLLCEASKIQGEDIEINIAFLARIRGVKENQIINDLKALEERGVLCPPNGGQLVDKIPTTNERTNVTNEQYSSLAFGEIYEKFPRKIGKSEGIKKLKVQVKTLDDFEALKKAVIHFAEYHRKEGTAANFIPYFSTWVNEWRDWLDPRTGTADAPKEQAADKFREYAQSVMIGIKKFGPHEGERLGEFLGPELWRITYKAGVSKFRALPQNEFAINAAIGILKESAQKLVMSEF